MKLTADNKLPEVTFTTRVRTEDSTENPFDWKKLTTSDYFAGKKCVLFALPGAFTPTCSTRHLPGYEAKYEEFKQLGVDEIYCLSVNDCFVMRKWGLDLGLPEDKTPGSLGFQKVKLIPDGVGDFTKAVGMDCNWSHERGFGVRSWRYSCYVDDMEVKKVFCEEGKEDNFAPDPFEVSDADTMLEYLRSN